MKLKRSSQITIRLEHEIYSLLKRVAQARGEDVSDFVRRAIKRELARLSYLGEEERKALNVKEAEYESL